MNITNLSIEDFKKFIQSAVQTAIDSTRLNSEINGQEARYLTIEEAAAYVRVAPQTLYGFTSKRQIPHFKRGKHCLFIKSELDAWLAEGKKKTVKEIREEIKNRG